MSTDEQGVGGRDRHHQRKGNDKEVHRHVDDPTTEEVRALPFLEVALRLSSFQEFTGK